MENIVHAYFPLIFERISVKLGCYIGSISSINPMNFRVRTPNVMVTLRQNNSSIPYILLFIATISQDLFNPCPWMLRPRFRLMGRHGTQFRAKADLPVGFPYRFNSSYQFLLFYLARFVLKVCHIYAFVEKTKYLYYDMKARVTTLYVAEISFKSCAKHHS